MLAKRDAGLLELPQARALEPLPLNGGTTLDFITRCPDRVHHAHRDAEHALSLGDATTLRHCAFVASSAFEPWRTRSADFWSAQTLGQLSQLLIGSRR
ncbi:hypothetical protein [Streptomyces virginiae]|uniref:hypothetical protein n=1 Tax=Streptomyces virginiae TaxID=1961 RepID=UPI003640EDD7